MEPDTTFAMSPSTTRNDTARTLQSGAEGCSLRSACDFCHSKRIKCVTTEGQSRCEPCIRRNGPCKKSFKRKTGPKPTRSTSNHDASEGRRRKRMRSSRREVINSSSGEDISTHSGKETTYHSFSTPEILLTQEQGAGVAFDFDWREGNGGAAMTAGTAAVMVVMPWPLLAVTLGTTSWGVIDSMADEETAKFVQSLGARIIQIEDESASHKGIVEEEGARCDDMATLSGDRGGDPLGGVIDSMTGEETNKFILGLVARIKQIEEESASHEGIADKGRESDDPKRLVPACWKRGNQEVGSPSTVGQWCNPISVTRAFSAPKRASGSDLVNAIWPRDRATLERQRRHHSKLEK